MIYLIIGMGIAFVLGAFVRKPFLIPKKEEPKEQPIEEVNEKEESLQEQMNKLFNYTGDKLDE